MKGGTHGKASDVRRVARPGAGKPANGGKRKTAASLFLAVAFFLALPATAQEDDTLGSLRGLPWYCVVAKAMGLGLDQCAEAPPPPVSGLPKEDRNAWKHKPPEPPPEPPPPAPAAPPPFPVVVVEREKVVEKETEAVETVPAAVDAPPPPPRPKPPPEPDLVREAAEASYAVRALPLDTWPEVLPPAWPSAATLPLPLGRPPVSPLPSLPPVLASYAEEVRISGLPVDNERILTTDRYVSGILETSINSQLAGEEGERNDVVIQVNRDVFGYHGRSILIPKGSRLVCGFRAPKQGESRLGLSCGRILLGGSRAEIYQAAGGGFDVQGKRGVSGEVDNRFWEKYGTALILSAISGAVRASSAAIPNEEGAEIAGEGAQELGERFGEITAAILEETVNLAPIISLPQGTRLVLRPGADWHIRRPGDPMPLLAGEEGDNEEG